MAISQKDLDYWEKQFRALLSGWPLRDQIQFHKHIIARLEERIRQGGTK